ncbi:hypothetical protein GcM3_129024, partial [Golovinomyces cichoracearum]
MRDPELPTLPRAPDLPQRPTVTGTVTEAQVEQIYRIMLTEHRFRYAANIDIEYSKYLSFQLEKKRKSGKIPQTVSMIEDFRNHQRQEEAMKSLEHPYLAKNLTKGVAATFKESEAEDG